MAMMKAIRITSANKSALEVQYNLEEGYLELSSGLYLVAGDGNAQVEGLLTPGALAAEYLRTGRKLNNEYFEVFPRSGVATVPEFSDAQA